MTNEEWEETTTCKLFYAWWNKYQELSMSITGETAEKEWKKLEEHLKDITKKADRLKQLSRFGIG
jgi:hypothetical protein